MRWSGLWAWPLEMRLPFVSSASRIACSSDSLNGWFLGFLLIYAQSLIARSILNPPGLAFLLPSGFCSSKQAYLDFSTLDQFKLTVLFVKFRSTLLASLPWWASNCVNFRVAFCENRSAPRGPILPISLRVPAGFHVQTWISSSSNSRLFCGH